MAQPAGDLLGLPALVAGRACRWGSCAAPSRSFARLSEPFIEFFRYLPAPAFGALAVAVLGIYDAPKVAIIFIGTFFQQVLVVANTTRRLDGSLVEAAQTLGASRRQLLFKVVVPGIVVDLYTDLRILLGWAWTYLIVAELVGTTTGITYFINQQARYRNYPNVYAGIMIIGLIGLGSDLLLARLGRHLFPWQPAASRLVGRRACCARCCPAPRRRPPPARARRDAAGAAAKLPLPALLQPHRQPAPRSRDALRQDLRSARWCWRCEGLTPHLRRRGRRRCTALDTAVVPGAPARVAVRDRALRLRQVAPSARIIAGLDEPSGGRVLVDGKRGARARAATAAWCSRATRCSPGARCWRT